MNSPEISFRLEEDDISLLFSPTKARQAAAQSASWKHVDERLRALFPPPAKVPRFERNENTLQALLALVEANEDADEERRTLHDARVEALSQSQAQSQAAQADGVNENSVSLKLKSDLLSKLDTSLSHEAHEALADVAASALLLSCQPTAPPSEPSTEADVSAQITHLTLATFDAENEVLQLQQTQRSFDREQTRLQAAIARFQRHTDPEVLQSEALQDQTQAMTREIKVVGMKLAEYQERIRALQNYDVGTVRTEDVVAKEEAVRKREEEVQRLEAWLLEMRGLPPDLDTSRTEVERARNELQEWKRRRETAFEALVE